MPEGPQPYRGARRNEMPTQSTASLFLFPNPLTYAKHMPIRMPQMHLSHFPRHVMRRKRHIQPRRNAFLVHCIHIFHPHGHPRTFVARFVPIHLKCSRVRSFAPSALRALAKKYLDLFSRIHRSKPRRRSPIPSLLPTPLLKPRKTRRNIGHIQYRSNPFCLHSAKAYHRSRQIKLLTRHSEGVPSRGTRFSDPALALRHSIPSLHRISHVLP